jgi:hypothetical protein
MLKSGQSLACFYLRGERWKLSSGSGEASRRGKSFWRGTQKMLILGIEVKRIATRFSLVQV